MPPPSLRRCPERDRELADEDRRRFQGKEPDEGRHGEKGQPPAPRGQARAGEAGSVHLPGVGPKVQGSSRIPRDRTGTAKKIHGDIGMERICQVRRIQSAPTPKAKEPMWTSFRISSRRTGIARTQQRVGAVQKAVEVEEARQGQRERQEARRRAGREANRSGKVPTPGPPREVRSSPPPPGTRRGTGRIRRGSPSLGPARAGSSGRKPRAQAGSHAHVREGLHSGQDLAGRAQNGEGQNGSRSLAQPEPELEHRLQAQVPQLPGVARLLREVSGEEEAFTPGRSWPRPRRRKSRGTRRRPAGTPRAAPSR
jgi:hypothetical protein